MSKNTPNMANLKSDWLMTINNISEQQRGFTGDSEGLRLDFVLPGDSTEGKSDWIKALIYMSCTGSSN
ncbi:hypothetical protein LDENG_00194290 [Lucifuga dentata]|nr:hypothetical protein LDENG_00194290 [Lucifuga dentata]